MFAVVLTVIALGCMFSNFYFLVCYHIVVVSQLFYSHPYKYLGSALAGLVVCMGTIAPAGIIEAMTSQPANVDAFDCIGGIGWLNWYCRCRFNVCDPFVAGIRKPCVDVSVIDGDGDCDWNVNAVRFPDDVRRAQMEMQKLIKYAYDWYLFGSKVWRMVWYANLLWLSCYDFAAQCTHAHHRLFQ